MQSVNSRRIWCNFSIKFLEILNVKMYKIINFKDQEQLPSSCFFRLDVVSFDVDISFVAGRHCTAQLHPFSDL